MVAAPARGPKGAGIPARPWRLVCALVHRAFLAENSGRMDFSDLLDNRHDASHVFAVLNRSPVLGSSTKANHPQGWDAKPWVPLGSPGCREQTARLFGEGDSRSVHGRCPHADFCAA